jgi:hypothetical protein
MLLAARLILGASLYRTKSRLSHFREDTYLHDARRNGNRARTRGNPSFGVVSKRGRCGVLQA